MGREINGAFPFCSIFKKISGLSHDTSITIVLYAVMLTVFHLPAKIIRRRLSLLGKDTQRIRGGNSGNKCVQLSSLLDVSSPLLV